MKMELSLSHILTLWGASIKPMEAQGVVDQGKGKHMAQLQATVLLQWSIYMTPKDPKDITLEEEKGKRSLCDPD